MKRSILEKKVKAYQKDGGTIETLPPAGKKTKRRKLNKAPKEGHDELCQTCPNIGQCLNMCLPLKWIDGHSETKEKLLREPVEQYDIKDYNETLHELIRSKQTDQIETIKLIKDKKIRAIASMLNVELTIKDISILFKCHTKTVRRWIHIKYLQ